MKKVRDILGEQKTRRNNEIQRQKDIMSAIFTVVAGTPPP
jgi:hypothetical protein